MSFAHSDKQTTAVDSKSTPPTKIEELSKSNDSKKLEAISKSWIEKIDKFIETNLSKNKAPSDEDAIHGWLYDLLMFYPSDDASRSDQVIAKLHYLGDCIVNDFKKNQNKLFICLVLGKGVLPILPKIQDVFEEKIDQIFIDMKKSPQDRKALASSIKEVVEFKSYFDKNGRNKNQNIVVKMEILKKNIIDDLMLTRDSIWIKVIFSLSYLFYTTKFIDDNQLINTSMQIRDMLIKELKHSAYDDRHKMIIRLIKSLKVIGFIIGNIFNAVIPNNFFEEIFRLIKKDYIITKEPDFLIACAQSNLILVANFAKALLPSTNDSKLEKTHPLLKGVQSYNRARLHIAIFHKRPLESIHLVIYKKASRKIINCVHELTLSRAIVGDKIYHWTTRANLVNIFKSNFIIYGNKSLCAKLIPFVGNAILAEDVKNGDGDVVCFCPYFIDPFALFDKVNHFSLKKNLVRLTVNPAKLLHANRFNQFFKLRDFGKDFDFSQQITRSLKIKIAAGKGGALDIILTLVKLEIKFQILKEDCVFYGNIYAINRFCIISLLNAILKTSPDFYDKLMKYLELYSDIDVKKILTYMGKAMIVFSEFNFNSEVDLQNNAITEVYFVESNSLYNLTNCDPKLYKDTLANLANNPDEKYIDAKQISVTKPVNFITLEGNFKLYGTSIQRSSKVYITQHPAVTLDQMDVAPLPDPTEMSLFAKI